jgi:hypothetical protein
LREQKPPMPVLARLRLALAMLAAAWALASAYFLILGIPDELPTRVYRLVSAECRDEYARLDALFQKMSRLSEESHRLEEEGKAYLPASAPDIAEAKAQRASAVRTLNGVVMRFYAKWRERFIDRYIKWSAFLVIAGGISYWLLRVRERTVSDPLGVR